MKGNTARTNDRYPGAPVTARDSDVADVVGPEEPARFTFIAGMVAVFHGAGISDMFGPFDLIENHDLRMPTGGTDG